MAYGAPSTPINNAKLSGTNDVLSGGTLIIDSGATLGVGTGASTPATQFETTSALTSSPRGIMSSQFNDGTDGARFHLRKGRGTRAAPTVVVTGDNLGRLVGSGYDGSNYLEMASIYFATEGTIASMRIPTNISFWTATNAAPSVLTQALLLDSSQNATLTGAMLLAGATGGMPSQGIINAKGFKINGVDVGTSSSSYWNSDAPGISYSAGPVGLNTTPTGGSAGMLMFPGLGYVTGSAGALTLATTSNGNINLSPNGTGKVTGASIWNCTNTTVAGTGTGALVVTGGGYFGGGVSVASGVAAATRTNLGVARSAATANVTAAGDTVLALGTGEMSTVYTVTVTAASLATYTATLSLSSTNAVTGSELCGTVAMPASMYPTVELRSLSSTGTLLGTITPDTAARTWSFRARYDGSAWAITSLGQQRFASVGELAASRNALAPRGGITFDGTSTAKVVSTLTNQNLGTDPFSVVITFSKRALTSGHHWLWFLSSDLTVPANVGYAIRLHYDVGNSRFLARITGATSSDYQTESWPYALTDNKTYVLTFIRNSSGSPTLYVDGHLVTSVGTAGSSGTVPSWQDTITSTYFILGYANSGNVLIGDLKSASLYNLALSAADVLEIHELGGAVPERYKYGSQNDVVSSGSALKYGAADSNNGTLATVAGGSGGITFSALSGARTGGAGAYYEHLVANGTNSFQYLVGDGVSATSFLRRTAQAFRYSLWARTVVGTPALGFGNTSTGTSNEIAITSSWQLYTGTAYAVTSAYPGTTVIKFNGTSVVGDEIDLDDMQIWPLGAVVHLALDDGYGYQLRDQSTNGLHATMTTTGVSHILPSSEVHHIRGTTSTSGNQQMYGQALIPSAAQILRARAKSSTGTPTISLGTASGGTQIVGNATLSTAWQALTLTSNSLITTADTSVWVASNTTATISVDITAEPLSP